MALKKPITILSNPKAECAGMSQMWLGLSILGGEPELKKAVINSSKEDAQRISMGKPSDLALPEAGLKILNHSVFNDLSAGLNFLLSAQEGHYYLTIKYDGGAHAMAAIVKSNSCYYFEPESGIYLLNINDKADLLAHYAGLKINVKEMKLYNVTKA